MLDATRLKRPRGKRRLPSAPRLRGDGAGKGRTCYVEVWRIAASIWPALQRGIYPELDPAQVGAGELVRIGAYGDPASVPTWVWEQLVSRARGWTGYTHLWRGADAAGLSHLLMASVEDEDSAQLAWEDGWRTFRILLEGDKATRSEPLCAYQATGDKVLCADCGACDSRHGNRTVHIH